MFALLLSLINYTKKTSELVRLEPLQRSLPNTAKASSIHVALLPHYPYTAYAALLCPAALTHSPIHKAQLAPPNASQFYFLMCEPHFFAAALTNLCQCPSKPVAAQKHTPVFPGGVLPVHPQ